MNVCCIDSHGMYSEIFFQKFIKGFGHLFEAFPRVVIVLCDAFELAASRNHQ